MAISEKQRQKKLGKKNKKIKNSSKLITHFSKLLAKSYSHYPIHECLVPDGLFDSGIGEIVIARRLTNGDIALSAFILDVYCLGVKNAMFKLISEDTYENEYKQTIANTHEEQGFEKTHPSCVKKLIEGAVAYAKNLGFMPHRDYANAIKLLSTADSDLCPVSYDYGQSGKPYYIQGPHETPKKVDMIMKKLHNKCGEGGYTYLIVIGDEPSGE